MLLIRGILRAIFQVVFFGAILFLPIGTWQWPRALQFLLVFGLISLASHLAMARWARASLEARVKRGAARDQPGADRWVTWVLALTHLAWFVVIPNDVFRWHVFPKPSVVVAWVGGVLCLLGYAIMLTAVAQNAFAAPVVGDQSHRHQVLVDKGVYGRIRHPMYLGHLLFLMGLPLWLESTLGLLLVPVVFAPVVARILVEENTLIKALQGYGEYRVRVPYRLIPFVW
jgi:protein-S-isoprenylcysteine O-methyltransferase Ste14